MEEQSVEEVWSTHSADNISTSSGAPGRPSVYKCSDCAKSVVFAGSFYLHRMEHLKCKECECQFQTAAGLSDHRTSCRGTSCEPSRKRHRSSSSVTKGKHGTQSLTGTGGRCKGLANLSCGDDTPGDSLELIPDDNTQRIGFAIGSQPPAVPLVVGGAGVAEQQSFSGTDTLLIQCDHQPHPLAVGTSGGKGVANGDMDELVKMFVVPGGGAKRKASKSFVCAECGLSFCTTDRLAGVPMEQRECGELKGCSSDHEKPVAAAGAVVQLTARRNYDENIPATVTVPVDLSVFPPEAWAKIISYLSLSDRCRLEGVSRRLAQLTKASWAVVGPKKFRISSVYTPSAAAKLVTLLRRCAPYLEELTTERDIVLHNGEQLGRIQYPNLRVLSFAHGSSFSLARGQSLPQVELNETVRRFLRSMAKLERLEFLSSVNHVRGGANVLVTLRGIVPCLADMQNVRELHLPLTWIDGPSVISVEALRHIRILSVMVPEKLVFSNLTLLPQWDAYDNQFEYSFNRVVAAICRLHLLEQLYLRLGPSMTPLFNAALVKRLAQSLPNLNSLVLRFTYNTRAGSAMGYIPVGCIDALIGQFAQLRTLVIVCRNERLEGTATGPVPVDLSGHRHRPVPLNIFVVDYNVPNFTVGANFTGCSPQINVIPIPNIRSGEAVTSLFTYNQNGFHFDDEKCLQMVKVSASFNGQWDFPY